jgi:hypothetical protein
MVLEKNQSLFLSVSKRSSENIKYALCSRKTKRLLLLSLARIVRRSSVRRRMWIIDATNDHPSKADRERIRDDHLSLK